MHKTMTPIGNSLGLVIERPILDLLKITRDTVLDISTDGRRLIIDPVTRPTELPADGQAVPADDHDFGDPRFTVQVLDALESRFQMSNEQFRRLHHARNYQNTIKAHRAYASDRPNRFQGGGANESTARRLQSCLATLELGSDWESAIKLASTEFPR